MQDYRKKLIFDDHMLELFKKNLTHADFEK